MVNKAALWRLLEVTIVLYSTDASPSHLPRTSEGGGGRMERDKEGAEWEGGRRNKNGQGQIVLCV